MSLFVAVIGAVLMAAPAALAQRPDPRRSPRDSARVDTVTTVAPAFAIESGSLVAGSPAPLLDAPVDRATYRLGPGDVVSVAIIGTVNRLQAIPVSPEGALPIPSVGIVHVLGLNLDEAQAQVAAAVRRYFRGIDVRLALSRVRTFKVFVVGDVRGAGMREASAATRVSEVVGADTGRTRVRRRNVLLRRASGDTVQADLARFFQTGDMRANPTLLEGDALIVPVVDERVDVYGRVHFPGRYEYRRGESLADFLEVVNGGRGFPSNVADSLRVVRFVDAQQTETIQFTRADAVGERGRAFTLRPFDAVYVPALSNFKEQKVATIVGQVLHPGTYPIRPETTTVRELVLMAGGFTPLASLVEATLTRSTPFPQMRGELASVPTEQLSEEERRLLSVRSAGNPQQVVIDFQRLFTEGGDAGDQRLVSGDSLVVPARRNDVAVLGAVRLPGSVSYQPGVPVKQVIEQAGGYTRRAAKRQTTVVRARQGARVRADEVQNLEPGDVVIVPFKEERSWLALLQNTQVVVSSITTLILTAIALNNIK